MSSGQWVRGGRLALLLVVAAQLSCLGPPFIGSFRPWSGSATFVESLRCNMTKAEIEATAQRFPPLEIYSPDSHPDRLTARKGDTLILLGLKELLLKTYQVSWTSGFTKQSFHLKHDLCSGLRYVELHLVGTADLAGASVWLDGELVGQLSAFGNFDRDVQLGSHHLKVQKAGSGSWSTELRYDESSSGYDRVPISQEDLQLH